MWLRPEERARYSSLFRELARFTVWTEAQDREDATETLPIAELPRAVNQWLGSLLGESIKRAALALSYGLDAADFLDDLATGRHGDGEEPDLEPIVRIQPPIGQGSIFSSGSYTELRRSYTERVLSTCRVTGRVPDGSSIRRRDKSVLVAPGEPFAIRIVRCHLSQDPQYECEALEADWPQLRPFDRAARFSFRAELLPVRTPAGGLAPWTPGQSPLEPYDGPLLRVPGHWITGVFDFFADPLGQKTTPARQWMV